VSAGDVNGPVPARAGIGLRFPHQPRAAQGELRAAWFEVHPENYMADEDALEQLHGVRARQPLSLHAVGLSLGSAAGVDGLHLARLCQLDRELNPGLVSDHLSWSVHAGRFLPDLLPLPYTDEALAVVSANVERVQQALGRQLLVENPSTYLRYAATTLREPEFLAALVERTGCGVLLDVNNIFVSASNQRADATAALDDYLRTVPASAIGELHLAGHARCSTEQGEPLLIDDHGSAIADPVWHLFERALRALGPKPTLIEWDTAIPAFEILQQQAAMADEHIDNLQVRYALAG
jgi:uncharacterized protein (UPF0276 family)